MPKDDVSAGPARDRPPVERTLLDVERRGALDHLLLDALRMQLDVDPVAARDEEDFVDLADEGVPELWIDSVSQALAYEISEDLWTDEALDAYARLSGFGTFYHRYGRR